MSERGSGRTTRMLMSVPDSGGVIVFPSRPSADHARPLARNLRGEAFAKACRFVVIASRRDIDNNLMGLNVPVFVDHHFREVSRIDIQVEMDAVITAIHSAIPENKRTAA